MAYNPNNPNGQATMANSAPVVIASNQSALPVTGTFWQTTQPVSGSVSITGNPAENIAQVNGVTVNVGTGAAGTGTLRVAVASDSSINAVQSGTWNIGSITTLPAITGTVTANAGTNLNTSLLQLDTTGAKLNVAQSTALGTNVGPMVQGSVTAGAPTYTTGNINPLSLTTSGALRVDGSGVTQPVSLTSTTITGSVTVAQATGTNLHAVLDTGSTTAVTQATAANLNATVVGTGTFAVQATGTVTANQGTANATPWNENIAQYGGVNVSLGQKTSANSEPVVIASDQSTLPVSLTSTTITNTVSSNVAQVGSSSVPNNLHTQPSIPIQSEELRGLLQSIDAKDEDLRFNAAINNGTGYGGYGFGSWGYGNY
jgi:hypothetical protein